MLLVELLHSTNPAVLLAAAQALLDLAKVVEAGLGLRLLQLQVLLHLQGGRFPPIKHVAASHSMAGCWLHTAPAHVSIPHLAGSH